MAEVFWPLQRGRIITSPYGPRGEEFHAGVDFGFPQGCGGRTVYAAQSGTVIYAGSAQGYGGSADGLCGWLVIDSDTTQGGGVFEYGHIRRLATINVGDTVRAGQRIAVINPDTGSNGNVAPHLHLSFMPYAYSPKDKTNPIPRLMGARDPDQEITPMGWTGDPTWLADVLKTYDGPRLKVRELPGWNNSGHGDMKDLWGVMIHHTGNATEPAESIRRGRPDLQGPLAQLHIAQDGTVTVVAVGVCWHAGAGNYPGIPTDNANYHLIGIECAWPRDTSLNAATAGREAWPPAQIIAMRDTTAAILLRLGVGPERVIGHKEWAGQRQGKWDPGALSMDWFRGEVGKAMRGDFKQARPIQPPPPPPPAPPAAPVNNNSLAAMTDRQLLEAIYRRIDGLAVGLGK
jgi:hypothetical protein